MPVKAANDDPEKARRFRDAHFRISMVYTLARYLLCDASDAETRCGNAISRALKHFDSYRGPAMKALAVRNPAQCLSPNLRGARVRQPMPSNVPDNAEQTRHEAQKLRRRRCCAAGTRTRSGGS
jgi:RNA polymerase sigma-70 factor (ECF subfamily)